MAATATENKVQFNLKNVHYAVLTGSTYGNPVSVPGAVSLSLDPEGSTDKFYADGLAYYVAIANNGYSGSIEMARFPDQMLSDIWGISKDSANVLVENANTEAKPFALLFQVDGDQDGEYYCFYNVKATRPGISAETTDDSKTPKTQSADITASPTTAGKVFARTTASTAAETKTGWFSSVYAG